MPIIYRRRHSRSSRIRTIKLCAAILALSLIGSSITILLMDMYHYTSGVSIDTIVAEHQDTLLQEAASTYRKGLP